MSLLSTAEQNRSLNLYYGANKGSIASPSHQVALFTDDPRLGGTELTSAGGYARITITNNGTTWPGASSGMTTSAVVTFPTSTAAWSDTASWFVLYATDTGDQGDSGPLDIEVDVQAAGTVVKPTLTVPYASV